MTSESKIKYITKDITTLTSGVIAHGVNCQGKMGSGVAKALREKWPVIFETYSLLPTGKIMLGKSNLVRVGDRDELFVVNCYTQLFYGYGGGKYADAKAVLTSLSDAFMWADYYDLPLYMPKIGAGLGGLDWEDDVEPIVEELDTLWSRVDTYVCIWGAS